MDSITKAKEWVNQNVPMLNILFQNKYIGMIYDRFASLPAKQQRQIIMAVMGGMGGILALYLLLSYYSLWSESHSSYESQAMINLLMQHQKTRRDKSHILQQLERNSQLTNEGAFKAYILSQAKQSNISNRFIQIEEKPVGDTKAGEPGKPGDVQAKQVTVTVDKVNLQQLKTLISAVEFGQYSVSIPSLNITNDDKIRGYMKAKFTVVAYVFQAEEGV
jgi:hypothetical protein